MAFAGLVIFDVDGTLFEANGATAPAIQDVLPRFGITPPDDEAIAATCGLPVNEYEAWLASLCPPDRADEIVDAINVRELELIREKGVLYEDVARLLTALKESGYALATCTNASSVYLDAVLDAHALRSFFDMNVCLGHGHASKTTMIKHILDAISARPAIMVGDRKGDVEAARANAIPVVAVSYGYGTPEELEGADAISDSVFSVAESIRRLS